MHQATQTECAYCVRHHATSSVGRTSCQLFSLMLFTRRRTCSSLGTRCSAYRSLPFCGVQSATDRRVPTASGSFSTKEWETERERERAWFAACLGSISVGASLSSLLVLPRMVYGNLRDDCRVARGEFTQVGERERER